MLSVIKTGGGYIFLCLEYYENLKNDIAKNFGFRSFVLNFMFTAYHFNDILRCNTIKYLSAILLKI